VQKLAPLVLLLLGASSAFASSPKPGDAAPPLAPEDIKGRALAVPAPGHVVLLSFASPSTGEAVGEIARALRVEHPELEIFSFIDLSGYPGFMHGVARGQIAKRHAGAVEATRAAFTRAGKTAPDDLDARIHIIPDFDAKSCKAYGASSDGNQPMIVLIGANGRIKAIFAKTPSLAEVKAAVARETSTDPPR
jgi:hypothetical protein